MALLLHVHLLCMAVSEGSLSTHVIPLAGSDGVSAVFIKRLIYMTCVAENVI